MKLNINDKVKVRLTDKGRDELRAQYEDLQLVCTSLRPYKEPVEDAEGYSEWKLWDLMSRFGELMCNGGDLYFDVEIIIPEQKERGEGEWIEWGGGECPFADDMTEIEVKFASGDVVEDFAGTWWWGKSGDEDDIIAYRIIPERANNQNGEQ